MDFVLRNFLISYLIELLLRISFYIFYRIWLAVSIYWHELIYIFYLVYTYFELLKKNNT